MNDSTRRPVGSVAEETARLLDALLAGSAAAGEPADPATGPPPSADGSNAGAAADQPHEVCATCGQSTGAHAAATSRAPADVCHLCPLCQLLRVVRSVRPETVDRLAELAAAVTDTLRDLAASRRAESAASSEQRRTTVQDIPVDDDDPSTDPAAPPDPPRHLDPEDHR